jgi:multidrug resistance efflux pump
MAEDILKDDKETTTAERVIYEPELQAELLSDEITEIISHRPHWVIRRGPSMFFVVLIGLMSITWFVRYPDTIIAPLRMNGLNTPKLLINKVEGKLVKLNATDQATVQKGQALAYMESTANHEQVAQLQNWISEVEDPVINGNLEIILQNKPGSYNQLGELQPGWQEFLSTYNATLAVLANGYYQQKKQTLNSELGQISQLRNNALRQKDLVQKDYDIASQEYNAKDSLTRENIIARIEFNQEKAKMITKQQQMEQMQTQLINNATLSLTKRQELLDLQKTILDQRNSFQNALFLLKSKVVEWAQRYILVSPESGKLQYSSFLQENQHLRAGQEMFYIVPDNSSYYGEVSLRQSGFGKIKKGQRVIIKFDSYPYTEFGAVEGTVSYISNIPVRDSAFLVRVDFNKGLKTNYNKEIFFSNNLTATAEIVTDDMRLIEKFFYQIRKAFQR